MKKGTIFVLMLLAGLVLATAAQAQTGWSALNSNTTEHLTRVYFRNIETGWAVGTNGTIIHTTDSGTTWEAQTSGVDTLLYDIDFWDVNTGTAVGYGQTILYTTDGGATWDVKRTDYVGGMYEVKMFSPDSGIVMGKNSVDEPLWGSTSDGWNTINWHNFRIDPGGREGWFLGCEFLTPDTWVACTGTWPGNGSILRTTDHGETWTEVYNIDRPNINSISFANDSVGVAVTAQGGVIRTTDGGINWSFVYDAGRDNLSEVTFANEDACYIAGPMGSLLFSSDQGENWIEQPLPMDVQMMSVCFPDRYDGTIATAFGIMYNTTTGGWDNEPPSDFFAQTPGFHAVLPREDMNFAWTSSSDPEGQPIDYTLWVKVGDNTPVSVETTDTTATVSLDGMTLPETQINVRWWVFATDGTFVVRSAGFNEFYLTGANRPPNAFNRLTPEDGTVVPRGVVHFSWEDATDPDRDHVSFTMTYNVNGTEYTEEPRGNEVDVDFGTMGLPPEAQTVTWNVTASDGELTTDASNGTGSFTLETTIFPEVSVEEIQTNPDLLGTRITTHGIVTAPTNSLFTDHYFAVIQDSTGYGVTLYEFEPVPQDQGLASGDSVQVVGVVREQNGNTQIIDFTVEVLSSEHPLPAPHVMNTGDMDDSAGLEGQYVEVYGQMDRDPMPGENFGVNVDDGSGSTQVYFYDATGLDYSELSEGTWATFRGVVRVFFGNVEISPFRQADIVPATFPAPSNLSASLDSLDGTVTLTWDAVETLHPSRGELDAFLHYAINRNNEEIATVDTCGFVDQLTESGEYHYTVSAVYDEQVSTSDDVTVTWEQNSVWDGPFAAMPREFGIAAAYPNPFNPAVQVVLAVPRTERVTSTVYDILGRKVATLVDRPLAPGYQRITWQPENLTSGIYFLSMKADGSRVGMKKLIFVK